MMTMQSCPSDTSTAAFADRRLVDSAITHRTLQGKARPLLRALAVLSTPLTSSLLTLWIPFSVSSRRISRSCIQSFPVALAILAIATSGVLKMRETILALPLPQPISVLGTPRTVVLSHRSLVVPIPVPSHYPLPSITQQA